MCEPEPETLRSAAGNRTTILVIEDNIDDQNLLKRQLTKSGVEDRVVCVDDGGIALNLIRDGTKKLSEVAAIFLDLSLSGVDGLLLLQAIRTNVETRLLPVFVVSGSLNPEDESDAKRFGATSFISKEKMGLPSFRSAISQMFHLPVEPEIRSTVPANGQASVNSKQPAG